MDKRGKIEIFDLDSVVFIYKTQFNTQTKHQTPRQHTRRLLLTPNVYKNIVIASVLDDMTVINTGQIIVHTRRNTHFSIFACQHYLLLTAPNRDVRVVFDRWWWKSR